MRSLLFIYQLSTRLSVDSMLQNRGLTKHFIGVLWQLHLSTLLTYGRVSSLTFLMNINFY